MGQFDEPLVEEPPVDELSEVFVADASDEELDADSLDVVALLEPDLFVDPPEERLSVL